MQDQQVKTLVEAIIGLTISHSLLCRYLIEKGTINKDDVTNALDYFIDELNSENPNQSKTTPMTLIRELLEQPLPDYQPPPPKDQRPKNTQPDWFRGLFQGGKQ